MNWVAPAGHKRRNGWMMWLGLSLGAVSAAIVGLYDAIQLAQGDEAFVLPLALGDGSRGSDVLLLILGWSIWGGAVGAICASAGYRRPVLLSGLVMSAFGGLIALSAIRTDTEVVWRLITYFSTGGLGFAILILVVDDVGCWWDAPRRCTIPKRRRRRFSSILRSFRFLSHPAWRFVGATLVLLVLMLRFVSRSRDVPEYARPQEPLIQEDVDGWERSLRNVDEETKNTAAYRTTLMLLGTDESELAADAHDEEGDASLSGSAADELEAANPRESDTTPASPDQTPASSADRPSAETP
ncbi:MAG: hypothetical protein DWQ34_15365 [Planctomycetota bacterium]|nr:MAG: hypothetical protein DWQ34_15365 [Planctomycetota bacterium]REJ91268.1 MAG: hypothetical protein DWQ29_05800 [Planctomycetota bacterium]REK28888.1 MAG: hypothetical protein DWQ41_04875 [Planctomycetota bacterium]REK39678.1 MAG: hypothetical protein DWQ45_02070 [Planctomycetota bacterium]